MTSPFSQEFRHRFILLSALAFVVATCLSGPLRMYLAMVGLSPLIYLPNAVLLAALAWQTLFEPHERGFTALTLIALLIPIYAFTIGLQFVSVFQAAMGIYVLIPFWFGLSCGGVLLARWQVIARVIPILWIVVITGVLVNLVVEYPWEGFGYTLGSLDVEGSRQWYAAGGGARRLAGFSRASFDAAVQVQLLGILFALQVRNPLVRAAVWAVTVYAIIPTNSKGILMVAMVLTPIILLKERLPESPLRAMPALFGMIGLVMPLSTLVYTFNNQFSNPTLANAAYSFYDRLNYMWPEAWTLLADHGNLLLGRGLGGIGTAQTYFESSLFNAGDNLFMYWFVIFGWAALPGFALLLLRTFRIKPCHNADQLRVYALLMATLVYGTMTNIVENAVFAIVCGLVVRWLCSTPDQSESSMLPGADGGNERQGKVEGGAW
jgi:hypothetical protein